MARIVRDGIFLLLAALTLTACGHAGSAGAAHSADPDHPGYQRYQDGGRVDGRVTGLRLSGQMRLTVRAGTTASVRRTVRYQDTDPGPGSWRVSGGTVELAGCAVPQCLISYDVTVPAGTALTGELDSGDADVRGIASVDLTARSGTVSIQRISGTVTIRAYSSTATVTGVGGAVAATVGSSQFTARNVRAALTVRGGSSTVIAQGIAGAATLHLMSGRAALGMASAQDVSASIASGSLTITVPRSAYHVVSSATSGELISTVPDSPAGAHRITLTLDSAQANLSYDRASRPAG